MQKRKPSATFTKIISYSLLSIFILIILTRLLLSTFFNEQIIQTLNKKVVIESKGDYHLFIDELTINLFTNSIEIKNISLSPNLLLKNNKTSYLFKATSLSINNISVIDYLKEHKLHIGSIVFEKPELTIYNENQPTKEPSSWNHLFSEKLKSICIENIQIDNASIIIYKNKKDSTILFRASNNRIHLKNVLLNAETIKKNSLGTIEHLELTMNDFTYPIQNGLYTLYGKKIVASSMDSLLTIDSVNLIPNYSKNKFHTIVGGQCTRLTINSSRIQLQQLDIQTFLETNTLLIKKIELESVLFDAYRDNTLPLQKITKPSLQTIVKEIPFYVSIDSIQLLDGTIKFEVYNPGETTTGKIVISNVNGKISGVSNDTLLYTTNSKIEADFTGNVMNKGKLHEHYIFPLKDKKIVFYCSGSITAMPLTSFNPILEQAKHLSIKSGQIDAASFSFSADEKASHGTMVFNYHNLEVEQLGTKNDDGFLKEKIKTFLLNKFVISDSNPSKKGITRTTTIHTLNNPYRYFLNFATQSVLNGVELSVKGK
jgi:hypothetical protein